MFESFVFCVLVVTLIYCAFEQFGPSGMNLCQASLSLALWATVLWFTGPVLCVLLFLAVLDLICRLDRFQFRGSSWQLERLATANRLYKTIMYDQALYTPKALQLASIVQLYLLSGKTMQSVELAKKVLETPDDPMTEDQKRMLERVTNFLRQCLREESRY